MPWTIITSSNERIVRANETKDMKYVIESVDMRTHHIARVELTFEELETIWTKVVCEDEAPTE